MLIKIQQEIRILHVISHLYELICCQVHTVGPFTRKYKWMLAISQHSRWFSLIFSKVNAMGLRPKLFFTKYLLVSTITGRTDSVGQIATSSRRDLHRPLYHLGSNSIQLQQTSQDDTL